MALQQAQLLWAEAREHKRLASHHRQAVRNTVAEIRALCARWGFDFEEVISSGGVDDSHGREQSTDP